MFADRITKVTQWHAPVVAYKPLDLGGAYQLSEGKLIWLGERLHNVGAHVVHGTLLDEAVEKPHGQKMLPVISKMLIACILTSSTAQGGGGSFKNRNTIGEVRCCDACMAEQIH